MPVRALCNTDVSNYGEPSLDELLAEPGVRPQEGFYRQGHWAPR